MLKTLMTVNLTEPVLLCRIMLMRLRIQLLASKMMQFRLQLPSLGLYTVNPMGPVFSFASFVSKREYVVPILAFHVCHDRRWWAACGTLCAEWERITGLTVYNVQNLKKLYFDVALAREMLRLLSSPVTALARQHCAELYIHARYCSRYH
jgi:hypothetical protein